MDSETWAVDLLSHSIVGNFLGFHDLDNMIEDTVNKSEGTIEVAGEGALAAGAGFGLLDGVLFVLLWYIIYSKRATIVATFNHYVYGEQNQEEAVME